MDAELSGYEKVRAHLARQYPHDGQGRHVQRDPRRRLERILVHLVAASDNVAGARRSLNNISLLVQLPQYLSDNLRARRAQEKRGG